MDHLEPIRRGYHALGLGAEADVLAMLDQGGPQPARWEILHRGLWLFGLGRRPRPAGEVAAFDLFALPPHLELTGVEISSWTPDESGANLAVGGHVRVRLRGTEDTRALPFSHVWRFENGRVRSVTNVLESFELRRLTAARPRRSRA